MDNNNLVSTVMEVPSPLVNPTPTTCITSKPQVKPRKSSKLLSLGGKKYVTIRKRFKTACVNIRTYSSDDCDFLSSTKRGIMLSASEWNNLKDCITEIDKRLNDRKLTLESNAL